MNPISVLTDHKNLEYFTTTKLLNRRQARWAQFLSQFNFKIIYRPGKAGAKLNFLTRRSRDLPKEGDKQLTENLHAVIKPHQILRLEAALGRRLGLEQRRAGLGLLEEHGTGLGHEELGTVLRLEECSAGLGLEERSAGLEGLKECSTGLAHGLQGHGAGLEEGHGLGPEEHGAGLEGLEERSTGLEGLEECGAGLGLGLVNAKITELFSEAYNWDLFPMKVLAMLEKMVRYCKDITLAECSWSPTGRLLYRGKFYVPTYGPLRLYLIQTHHEVPVAGHPGRSKTLELLSRNYHWPKMRQDVERFGRNCHTCRRSKSRRHTPFGVLRPLAIPQQPWQDISMDFVTGLP